jgi:hypothetical protein
MLGKRGTAVLATVVLGGAVALGGCGGGSDSTTPSKPAGATTPAGQAPAGDAMKGHGDAMKQEDHAMKDQGDSMKQEGHAMKGHGDAMKQEG